MKKFKVKENLKKLALVIIAFFMIGFMMPARAEAGIIGDFIDLIFHIPDGILSAMDKYIGYSPDLSYREVNFKRSGRRRCHISFFYNTL